MLKVSPGFLAITIAETSIGLGLGALFTMIISQPLGLSVTLTF